MKQGNRQNQQMLPSRTPPIDVAAVVRQAAFAIVSAKIKAPEKDIAPPVTTSESEPRKPAPIVYESVAPKTETSHLSADGKTSSAPAAKPIWISVTDVWRRGVDLWNENLKRRVQKGGRLLAYGFAGWFAIVITLIVVYRFINPPASNLMLYHYAVGRDVKQTWTPLKQISPAVIKAVITAEDARFCRHWGIDFVALEQAIEAARGGTPRGASTITMQTAKNMFLWQSKSYIRKILEVPVTILLELVWGKKRILEVYLNVAEWGPGVFGIGAAAKHHFNTVPAKLGSAAAAQLAAALPNPKVRRAGRPGPKTRRKARVIRGRARNATYYTGCILR